MDELTMYVVARRRLVRAARLLDDDQLRMVCPSCPKWSNQDVIAHHIHFFGAMIDGSVPPEMFQAIMHDDDAEREAAGRVRDEWTEAGVEERRGRTLDELITEWDERMAGLSAEANPALDAVVHLGDVLESVGERRGCDTELTEDALFTYYEISLAERVAAHGDGVILRCVDTGTTIGAGPGVPVISGTGTELLRAIAGRRTRAEADDALDWGGAPESTRAAFSAYGWPES